jgi:hypothetical protein
MHVALRLANADSVISGELLQQTDSLAKQALPVIPVGVLHGVHSPLLEQHSSGILAREECRYGLLKAAAEALRCPRRRGWRDSAVRFVRRTVVT